MDYSVSDYVGLMGLAVSFVAIWYTIKESRRNNSVVVAVRECGVSATANADSDGRWYYLFKIVLQNCGIALHDIEVQLFFRGQDGIGSYEIGLEPEGKAAYLGEFAKGMIAEFEIQSNLLNEWTLPMITELKDPVKQAAEIRVTSQGHLVCKFPVGSAYQRVVARWNHFASWVTHSIARTITRENEGPWIIYTITLPKAVGLLFPVTRFAESVSKQQIKEAKQNGPARPPPSEPHQTQQAAR